MGNADYKTFREGWRCIQFEDSNNTVSLRAHSAIFSNWFTVISLTPDVNSANLSCKAKTNNNRNGTDR